MSKFVIAENLLNALLSLVVNAIHPSVSIAQVNKLVKDVQDTIAIFEEEKKPIETEV